MNPPTKRCTKCGQEFPATSEYFTRQKQGKYGFTSTCKPCHRTLERDYREANPEKKRERTRLYYERHKPEIDRKHKHYRNVKRDAIRAHDKERSRRPDRVAKARVWTRKYKQSHPNADRNSCQTRRARKSSLPATFTLKDWQRCLDYWNNSCAYCGRPRGLWHTMAQDHFIPLSRGGPYTPENIVPACSGIEGCNNSKNASDPHKWILEKFGKRKAQFIEQRIAAYFAWVKSQE
jgi:hypothetical protein